jgi:antitoxin (DNA-binding transcriptional repressor) of toxin-antitoxin stability system
MKVVTTEEFRNHVDQYLASAAREEIVLTENGQPYILLQGLADAEGAESGSWGSRPEFWELIHQRRQERAVRWEEAKQQLALE